MILTRSRIIELAATPIPTAELSVTSKTFRLKRLSLRNTDAASAITILIKDGRGIELLPTISLPKQSFHLVVYPDDAEELLINGMTWQASAAGLIGSILGYEA